MSRSARPALAFAIILAVGLLVGSFMLRSTTRDAVQSDDAPTTEIVATDVRTDFVDVRTRPRTERRDSDTSAPRPASPGVTNMPTQTAPDLPGVTGYMVDRFESWTGVPPGYRVEGLVIRDGLLTLAGDAGSTEPRTGTLSSPPLPLRSPTLAGPVDDAEILPEGASVQLLISLSPDGEDWSPWVQVDRYRKPEGTQIRPAMQATIAKADLMSTYTTNSSPVGPQIRYRLAISASGVASPSLADIRIWKRSQ